MKTDVAIIGGGPSGLLLSQLLNQAGIGTIIVERATRAHVLSRIRAGVLESGSVDLLHKAGVGDRLARDGIAHDGCMISDDDLTIRIDFRALTGRTVTIFGQTEVTADLYAAQDTMGTTILHEVADVEIHDPLGAPHLSFTHDGQQKRIDCRFVAGCDGFHGVSRQTIPADQRQEVEKIYPFGWLGILSETPPAHDELIYAHSKHGFALASMRNAGLSRYYVQVPLADKVSDWSDEAFWHRLKQSLPRQIAETLVTGPSIEKSIAPLRSFATAPMRYGNLFLVGDAAHIVPPTGAKGLNLAVSDVFYLQEALIKAFHANDVAGIEGYSDRALARVWQALRFSWSMTGMLHQFDGEDRFAGQMRRATLAHLARSETARRDLAENYVGLPY